MKFLSRLLLLSFLSAVTYGIFKYQDQIIAFYHLSFAKELPEEHHPNPVLYEELKSSLAQHRRQLEIRYASAQTSEERDAVKKEAQESLERELPKMMRCWLGTPWAFHGTSQTPGSGEIACGYFVSTILRDAGFRVERIRLAQQPSQNIIATFIPRQQMHIRVGKSYDDFLTEVVSRGPGIRIVGLDTHVAFLLIGADEEVRFIHSSRSSAKSVVDENQKNAYALRASRYRVTGNITANHGVLHQWLTNSPLATKS